MVRSWKTGKSHILPLKSSVNHTLQTIKDYFKLKILYLKFYLR